MQVDFQMKNHSQVMCIFNPLFSIFLLSQHFLLSLGAAVSCWPFSVLNICLILERIVSRRRLLTQWPSSACLQRQREADEIMSETGKSTDMLSVWNDSCTHTTSLLLISVWQEVHLEVFHCGKSELFHAWVSSKGPQHTLVKHRLHLGPCQYEGGL